MLLLKFCAKSRGRAPLLQNKLLFKVLEKVIAEILKRFSITKDELYSKVDTFMFLFSPRVAKNIVD